MDRASETPPSGVENSAPAWLFVGDFLFYLRLLALQFSTAAKATNMPRKTMVVVPDPDMVWKQLATEPCEVIIFDCVEATEACMTFFRTVREHYPHIRCVLVSAALNNKMEAQMMEAGAHFCFAKPKTDEEARSIYQLVNALTTRDTFQPENFRGLPPSRFIQFLCARGESGSVALHTNEGIATLALDEGRIVDASLGDLRGDAAAARILALDQTQSCHFKHMLTSQFRTIHLHTHQLWLDSGKLKSAKPSPAPEPRAIQPKSLGETMAHLDSQSQISFDVQIEPQDAAAGFPTQHP